MISMMIVDDNPRDRKKLQGILEWENLNIRIDSICCNGKQGLEEFEKVNPDIILTDIAMPLMNGIEMARKIKQINKDVKIIFMSCYDDFNFAKTAIDLDVQGYIMKPFILEEVEDTVRKVLSIFKNECFQLKERQEMLAKVNEALPVLREQFFKELLCGVYPDPENILKRMEFLKLTYKYPTSICIMSMLINNRQHDNVSITDKYLISYYLKTIIDTFNNNEKSIHIIQMTDAEYYAVIFCHSNIISNSRNLLDFIIEIYDEITDKLSVTLTLGISKISQNPVDAPELLRQADKALKTKFYGTGTPIILYEEIEDNQYGLLDKNVNMQLLYNEIKEIVSSGSEMTAVGFLHKYMDYKEIGCNETYFKSLAFTITNFIQVNLIEAGHSLKDIFEDETIIWRKLSKFETINDIHQWLYNMLSSLIQFLNNKANTRDAHIVEDIQNIIKSRYSSQLTLDEIAQTVFLSPNHANNIFKKETGKTIFDFLTDYRLEMAKKMLRDPYCKIYLVSENVGYVNKSHFGLLFKRYTGLTPMEYKNRYSLEG